METPGGGHGRTVVENFLQDTHSGCGFRGIRKSHLERHCATKHAVLRGLPAGRDLNHLQGLVLPTTQPQDRSAEEACVPTTQAGSRLQEGAEHRPEAVGQRGTISPRRRAEEWRERAEEGLELALPRLHLSASISLTTLNVLEKQMRSLPVLGR